MNSSTNTLDCTIVEVHDKDDFGILLCGPGHTANSYLPITASGAQLPSGTLIDIIGYPAQTKDRIMMHNSYRQELEDIDTSKADAQKMLPPRL